MVVVRTTQNQLENFIGDDWEKSLESFSKVIGFSFDSNDAKDIKIELNPDRPDLYSIGSIINQYFIFKKGYPTYGKVIIQKREFSLENVKSRPFFVAFETSSYADSKISYNINTDFLEYSDRVSETVGKQRSKFSVGAHDQQSIKGKIKYGKVNPETKIVTYDGMEGTISQLISRHEKGIKYGNLKSGEVVGVLDEIGIASVPPFFNTYRTRINDDTNKMVVDISASSEQGLMLGFRLMAGYFIAKGIDIILPDVFESVWNLYKNNGEKVKISLSNISKVTGIREIKLDLIKREINRMGIQIDGENTVVPLNRVDIMGEIDIIEDFVKAYGVGKIEEKSLKSNFIGKENESISTSEKIGQLMVSLGFQEVKNFVLRKVNRYNDKFTVLNPKSLDYSRIRQDLFDGLITFLERNKSESFPQYIYETGDIIDENGTQETHMGCIICGKGSSYDSVKGILDSIVLAAGIKEVIITPIRQINFIDGRVGTINFEKEKLQIGILGEVSPEELKMRGIPFPASYLEIKIAALKSVLEVA
ncbi:MAG: hypothetical protein ACYCSO_05895 [Cuniculiplasma sp.]